MTQYKLKGDTLMFSPFIPYKKFWLNYKVLNLSQKQRFYDLVNSIGANLKDSQGYSDREHCGASFILKYFKNVSQEDSFEMYFFSNGIVINQYVDAFKDLLFLKDDLRQPSVRYLDKISFHSFEDTLEKDPYSWEKVRYKNFTLWSSLMFKDTFTVLKRLDFDVNETGVKRYEVSLLMDSDINKRKYNIKAMYLFNNNVYMVFRSGIIHQFKGIYLD
ncbi:MAG TPA: hypothetical protein VGF79_12210 [Bacteroidia bacterium]